METICFTIDDFNVFTIEGLENRMTAIQERIQPKFRAIGEELTDTLSILAGNEMYLHIAKHLRRTKNPPNDTWLAIGANKRGYKMLPHFQVGLFDDHLFIWLAFIYELPNKKEIATKFLTNIDLFNSVPNDFVISLDHTRKEAVSIKDINLKESLARFRDIKKAEFLIGRHIAVNDPILTDGNKFLNMIKELFGTLIPLYKLSYK